MGDARRDRGALTHEEREQFRKYFDAFDQNSDGRINSDEIENLLTSLGIKISNEAIAGIIEKLDKDGDGAVDFEEFLGITDDPLFDVTQKELLSASFKEFDRDEKNYISREDLRAVLHGLGILADDADLDAMMSFCECKRAGFIDFREFERLTARVFPGGHSPRPKWV